MVGTYLLVLEVNLLTWLDIIFQELLAQLKGRSYAVLFATTPVNSKIPTPMQQDSVADVPDYESEFQEPLHLEIKRQAGTVRRADSGSKADTRPLFEKYQFFTPGMNLLIRNLRLQLNSYRHFHGVNGDAPPFDYPFRRRQGPWWPRSVVCRVRKRDGSCGTEESAVDRDALSWVGGDVGYHMYESEM